MTVIIFLMLVVDINMIVQPFLLGKDPAEHLLSRASRDCLGRGNFRGSLNSPAFNTLGHYAPPLDHSNLAVQIRGAANIDQLGRGQHPKGGTCIAFILDARPLPLDDD